MKIVVDTKKDSIEDIRKAIGFLEQFVGKTDKVIFEPIKEKKEEKPETDIIKGLREIKDIKRIDLRRPKKEKIKTDEEEGYKEIEDVKLEPY